MPPSDTAGQSLVAAAGRDAAARARDLSAAARDRAAVDRDDAADESDRAEHDAGTVSALRRSAASLRRQSALERTASATDRAAAMLDRQQAAADRQAAGFDELTGVLRRGVGEQALTREIDRSRRSRRPLILAVIDVDQLKTVNDQHGHAAGDTLLRDIAAAISSTMRSYDLTVRWGGDEFVCALSDATLDVAADRVAELQRALSSRRPGAAISAGLSELDDDDTLESVIARADLALYRAKPHRETR
jgi:diguanylate cyclase (GGDEF)-like protein